MLRILLKDDYKTDVRNYKLFLNQIRALFDKSFVSMFKKKTIITYVINCNKDNEIEFYFDVNNEDKKEYLKGFLKTLFFDTEIIDVDFKDEFRYSNAISKYKYAKEYQLLDFDHTLTKYILNSMSKNTAIVLKYYVDQDDSYFLSVNVATDYEESLQGIKNICSTVQQTTAADESVRGKKIKLYVKYNSHKNNYMKLSVEEILNFLFIPYDMKKIATIDKYQIISTNEQGIVVGRSLHPLSKDKEFKIPFEVMRKHGFLSGQTGSGKSSLFEMIVKSVIQCKSDGTNVGFTLYDPKGASCVGVVNAIEYFCNKGLIKNRNEFYKKVRYIDLNLKNTLFSINLIDKSTDVTFLIDFFRNVFNSSGVRLERYITSAVGLLHADEDIHYVDDILKLFDDEEYRRKIVHRNLNKPHAKRFITVFRDVSFKEEEIAPIRNRLEPFMNTYKKELMFNSGHDLHEVRKWMDEGYIVIFNLNGFSKNEIELIIGYITLQYHLKAKKRPNGANSHYMFIEEAHNVQLDITEKIIAEDRSQGLHIFPMTQFLEQYKKNLLESITGNVASKIVLQQGNSSSSRAGAIVGVKANILENMKKFHAYVVSENDEGEVVTSYVKIDPPYRYDKKGNILDYDISDKKKMFEIQKREEELLLILKDNMRKNYPMKNVVVNNDSVSNIINLDNDIFVKDGD